MKKTLPNHTSGVRAKIRDGLGSAKEISAALSRSLEKRGLMKPLGSKFGAAKATRYVECITIAAWLSMMSLTLYADDTPKVLTLRTGEAISIVAVTSVDARSVHYQTATGCGSVEIADLTKDLQARFAFDPKAAAEADAIEARRQAESDAMVAATLAKASPVPQPCAIAASAPKLSIDRAAIQAQIAGLNADINRMGSEEPHGGQYTVGAYPKLIEADRAAVLALTAQLK
jgi:hypothetical protein